MYVIIIIIAFADVSNTHISFTHLKHTALFPTHIILIPNTCISTQPFRLDAQWELCDRNTSGVLLYRDEEHRLNDHVNITNVSVYFHAVVVSELTMT